jgi:hypothetical protein
MTVAMKAATTATAVIVSRVLVSGTRRFEFVEAPTGVPSRD